MRVSLCVRGGGIKLSATEREHNRLAAAAAGGLETVATAAVGRRRDPLPLLRLQP